MFANTSRTGSQPSTSFRKAVTGDFRMSAIIRVLAICAILATGNVWADDGRLTAAEAEEYGWNRQIVSQNGFRISIELLPEREIDPGWKAERFPDHAVCYRSPKEIAAIYAKVLEGKKEPFTSYPKPKDGALRIVGTGHSFMMPGYATFPAIARAAGFSQPPLVLHLEGGYKGSARYKWEEENGVFQFDGRPKPKLLASIANAEWDVMMWGPSPHDRPAYYACWIDFCLKYNPQMKFYLSNSWPMLLKQLDKVPTSEDEITAEAVVQMGEMFQYTYSAIVRKLNKKYPGKVFVLPTCDAMVLALQSYKRGELPGVEGIHRLIGKKERSIWKDAIGHLGPGFERLEGYVFYATLYGRSPELIAGDITFAKSADYPGRDLDRTFRKIAWQAAVNNPLSGVVDKDGNGIRDKR